MEFSIRTGRQYLPKGKSYEMKYAEKCNNGVRLQLIAKLNHIEQGKRKMEQLFKREKMALETDLERIHRKQPETSPHRCLKRIRREQVREWLDFVVSFQVKAMENITRDDSKVHVGNNKEDGDLYLKDVNIKPMWKRPVSSCSGRLREKMVLSFQQRFTKAMDSSLCIRRCKTFCG